MIATLRRHADTIIALVGLMLAAGAAAALVHFGADAVVYAMEHSP